MSKDDFVKIRVSTQQVGITGLKAVMEDMAGPYAEKPDHEIQAELVRRVSRINYIPDPVKEAYGRALFREFNKFLGRPYEDDRAQGLEIKVLGPGCARCDKLEMDVMEVAAELKIAAAVDHVRDIREIASYGVMGTPALVINKKVVSVGTVPSKEKIRDLLREHS